MKTWRCGAAAICGLMLACGALLALAAPPAGQSELRKAAAKLQLDGNHQEALEIFRRLALDPADDRGYVGSDLQLALACLRSLGRGDEVEALLENVVQVHAQNSQLLLVAADLYLDLPHNGTMVAGKFVRGGRYELSSERRDRVRALQLAWKAIGLLQTDPAATQVGGAYMILARALFSVPPWQLQSLTDFETLPDYSDHYGRSTVGAPVGPDGQPVYYHVPESFESAHNDGERWRWALEQAAKHGQRDRAHWQFAQFLQSQFGVETLGWDFRPFASPEGADPSGIYALHTLKDDETIARLATGIQRFTLPDEFNYLKLYQPFAADPNSPYRLSALDELAELYENRRQYPRAAEYWRRGNEISPIDQRAKRLEQIVGNWGRFEPGHTQPAGRGADMAFRFRNAKHVRFEARRVDIDKLLADVKAYLKTRPLPVDSDKIDVGNIGYRIIENDKTKYLGQTVAEWELDLDPPLDHFDRQITVSTPLQKAGAYLVTATVDDGNTSRMMVWLDNTVIVKKPLAGKTYYYVADAVTGEPLPGVNVEFFGFRVQYDEGRPKSTDTLNFADVTDPEGQLIVADLDDRDAYQWLAIARGEDRLAYLGFNNMWFADRYEPSYDQLKVFTITDRPVYRPHQTVNFKFWIRQAKYEKDEGEDKPSPYADRDYPIEIHNPRGDKVFEKTLHTDAYGGLDGSFELPSDAVLGQYQLMVVGMGGDSFRVEEYKKPEFEVNVEAPHKPVALGDKIKATVEAKYYFGAPVVDAKVHYKVTRSASDESWYPPMPWDWFYGPGYWWFAYDYDWYPGFARWGCFRPTPWWWNRSAAPPEVVADAEVPLGEDGTVDVEIDTAVAKELHGDQDHTYTITAEVTDQSRRTIVGVGRVQAAREPFKVFVWLDHGYYEIGDTVEAHIAAHTLDHKPVAASGELQLLKITYDRDAKPTETEVGTWEVTTDAEGRIAQKLSASAAGQYRLSCRLTDEDGHAIEGGYIFNVIGEGFDGADFQYNHLELIPDKTEYAAGETVKLLINTDRVGSTVLVFVRPQNGTYLPPKVLRLSGKSTTYKIGVTPKDMPNFFVEALTITDAKLHDEAKEIVVPPTEQVLNVVIESSADEYKPGEQAEIKLTLTDDAGQPFVGSTVLTVYDKALEYIAGGSNVPEIKEFFWKWRRHHYASTENSLNRYFDNLLKRGEVAMNNIGRFGELVLGLEQIIEGTAGGLSRRSGQSFGGGGRSGGMVAESAAPAAPMSLIAGNSKAKGEGSGYFADALASGESEDLAHPLVEPTVRTNFADTALWIAALETDAQGHATAKLTMPENLTTWKIRTWAMGHGTRVGQADANVITTKNLLVRMQAPRFFVETDQVVLSANVHNYLDSEKDVEVVLELDGLCLTMTGETKRTVEIPAGGEMRVDWRVTAVEEGEAVVRMKALSDEESDAMEMKFPVHVHGMAKTQSFAGALAPDQASGQFTFDIPAQRREAESRVEVRFSPSLAGAMVDALPYLVNYPYGCTEQTLNRFLPTVIVQKILLDTGIDLADVRRKRTNLNAQQLGDAQQRARQWKIYDRNPVFDEREVDSMVKAGLQRLTEMQVSDGGWGWFSGYGEQSYPHTTAVVVHGLQVAQSNGVGVVPDVLARGVAWLKNYQQEQVALLSVPEKDWDKVRHKQKVDSLDALVYMVLVDAGESSDGIFKFLERDRAELGVYAKTLYGLALEKLGKRDELAAVLRNLEQYVEQDDENQTAWFRMPDGNAWWHWHGDDIEAMGYYLKLLSRTDPQGETTSRLVKYLINNRHHATYWNSTRDTAIVIEALAEYLKASGQASPHLTVEILVDGKVAKTVEITSENLFSFDNTLVLAGDALSTGRHTIEFRKQGAGRLYYNGYVSNFTLEPFITKTGLEIKVDRKFFKLVRNDKTELSAGGRGQALDQRVEHYDRVPLPNLSQVTSGDLVEIELTIDSKNDYEYVMFEDLKAAGFEPVDVRSGYHGNALGAYVEFRDDRVTFFARAVARGRHSVSYRLRAEIPGSFSALPALGEGMYAPELRANSDEMKIEIVD